MSLSSTYTKTKNHANYWMNNNEITKINYLQWSDVDELGSPTA